MLAMVWITGICLGARHLFLTTLLSAVGFIWQGRKRLAVVLALGALFSLARDPRLNRVELEAYTGEGSVDVVGTKRLFKDEHYIFLFHASNRVPRRFLSVQSVGEDDVLFGQHGLGRTFHVEGRALPFKTPSLALSRQEQNQMAAQSFSGRWKIKKAWQEGADRQRLMYWPLVKNRLLTALRQRMDQLGGDAGPFLARILLGTNSTAELGLFDDMKGLGLAHLLAASGLHINLLYGAGILLGSWLPVQRKTLAGALFCLLFFYAAILDFPASILRALFFQGASEWAITKKRKISRFRRFLFALTLVLLEPLRIFDLGLQLSFLAALAIEWQIHSIPRVFGLRGGIRLTVRILLFTLPALAMVGLPIQPAALLTNLFAVPFFGALFALGLLSLLLMGVPILGPLLVGLLRGALILFRALLQGLSFLPLPQISLVWSKGTFALYGGLLALLVARDLRLLGRAKRFFASSHLVHRRQVRGFQSALRLAICLLSAFFFLPEAARPFSPAALTLLNVEQGDGILFEGGGRAYLFDTGGQLDLRTWKNKQAENLALTLRNRGIDRLDAVFLSHDDYDHVGNLPILADRMPIGCVVHAPEAKEHKAFRSEAGKNIRLRYGAKGTLSFWVGHGMGGQRRRWSPRRVLMQQIRIIIPWWYCWILDRRCS